MMTICFRDGVNKPHVLCVGLQMWEDVSNILLILAAPAKTGFE